MIIPEILENTKGNNFIEREARSRKLGIIEYRLQIKTQGEMDQLICRTRICEEKRLRRNCSAEV